MASDGGLPSIVLARHGRPDLRAWPRIPALQMAEWIAAYDAAGIKDTAPPSALRRVVEGAGIVVSSTSRRAIESAAALAPAWPHVQDPLFREAALPHAPWAFPMLPPQAWAAAFRVAWLLGFDGGVEPAAQARARAREAAGRLIEFARQSGSVCLFGHGIMNRLIARELAAAGWRGPKRPASRYWDASAYTPGDRQA